MRAISSTLENIRSGKSSRVPTSQEVSDELAYQRYRAAEHIVRTRIGESEQLLHDRIDELIDRLSDESSSKGLVDEFMRLASLSDELLFAELGAPDASRVPLRRTA